MPSPRDAGRFHWPVLMVVGLGVVLALASVWFHHSRSHRAVQYWGAQAAALLAAAPEVQLWQLAPATDQPTGDASFTRRMPPAGGPPSGELPSPPPRPSSGDAPCGDHPTLPDATTGNDSGPPRGHAPAPAHDAAGNVVLRGRTYVVQRRIDLSAAPGMLHLRRSLLSDALYDWSTARQVVAAPGFTPAVSWHYALQFRSGTQQCTVLTDAQGLHIAGPQPEMPVLGIQRDPQGHSPLRRFIEDQIARQSSGSPPR